ncbi:MAG: hypothetical protein JXQ83_10515, partial [Candidatus Glassbacteria bacterium]|nr:hypothetical protein [Candidatus Glassbacteria bacterium]
MSQFTKNFEQFNREHPVMDDSSAELLTGAFPEAEHFSLGGSGDGPLPQLTAEKDGARVVALLTAGKTSKKTQSALAEALQSLLKSHAGLIAVDMDIFSPHSELLGTENEEGLTDHFLYGVSPENILRDSKRPGLKAITPGTFTPRTDEVYGNPRWKSLINWLSKETGRTVVLLAPPLERLGKFPALKYADTVVLLAEPLAQGQPPDDLQRILETVSRSSAPGSALRMLWLGENEPKTEEPVEAEPKAVEPETVEPVEAEPEAAEPETVEPVEAEPEAAEPEAAEPVEAESEAAEPEAAEPVEAEPEAAEPEAAEPVEAEPEAAEPEAVEPVEAEPEAAEPEAAEPVEAEPEAAEPETAEPVEAEPEAAEPEISGLDMLDETERIEIPDLEPEETLEGPGDLAGVELDQAPAEKPKADSEVELEAPETPDLDTLDEAEQIKVPELEPAEDLEAPEAPAGEDLEPAAAESPEAAPEAGEKEAEPDSEPLKTIEKQPEPVEEAVPERVAPAIESPAEEKKPDPGVTEPSAEEAGSAAAGKPVEDLEPPEGEDEIFLPDELLFLDEDDKTGETVKSSQNNLDEEELTGLNYDALPDLKTMDEKAEELPEPAGKEDSAARDREELVSAEAGAGDQAGDGLEMEEGEAEALYTQVEPEDEPPAEESHRTAAGPVDETRSAAAMEKMESFEKSLNAPRQKEARLEIDTDPLAEEESRPEGPETGEPVEAAPAGEEAPEDEAAPELDLEELEPAGEAE